MAEFGEERRSVVSIREVSGGPRSSAILAAEDERFYPSTPASITSASRAPRSANLVHGGRRRGASPITMQVARNFFLTSEKTFTRKLDEALLAFKIEHNLTKDQILELYINQIYLGQRAYGFAAGSADTYLGKPLERLTLAEAAVLAGLPKAPSAYNPVAIRRCRATPADVLRRMQELGYISEAQYAEALSAPLQVLSRGGGFRQPAPITSPRWCRPGALRAVRRGDLQPRTSRAHDDGCAEQEAAYAALRAGCSSTTVRQRYRGPEAYALARRRCDRGRLRRGARRVRRRRRPARRARPRRARGKCARCSKPASRSRSPARGCGSCAARSRKIGRPAPHCAAAPSCRVQRDEKRAWHIAQPAGGRSRVRGARSRRRGDPARSSAASTSSATSSTT
ncbi:MAG: transglycosylase domain-containing protein [Burkholderiales bacterium]|nr:transglycosylase domain-containing protein [Burkholderiales bacterium]